MKFSIDDLLSLVSSSGRAQAAVAWGAIEEQLGFQLPADYKAMVESYGSGCFDDFFWLLVPGDTNENLDLFRQRVVRLDALRKLSEQGEGVPFPLDRSHHNLIPWAITDNGDVCYWVVSSLSEPDGWTVVVNEARGSEWLFADSSAAEFLVGVLSGSVRANLFPEDFPSAAPTFRPSLREP